jgi:hypothetical protein
MVESFISWEKKMEFKTFLESEEQKDVEKLISSLPKKHRDLLNGYKFKYTSGNTLDGDNDHIGYIFKNRIVVAAPWNYSRAFTTLHEIAHLVWEYIMTKDLKKKWEELVKKTKQAQIDKFPHKEQKHALQQNAEEIFCMSYAAAYCTHSPVIWVNEDWINFVKKI